MKVIYTALFGDYDRLRDPLYVNGDYRYVIFTDQPIQSDVWDVAHVRRNRPPARMNRYYKANSHLWFPHDLYDLSIYMDANIQQACDMNEIVDKMQGDMLLLTHPSRNCIYDEAETCIRSKKDSPYPIKQQVARYRDAGYPENNGLFAGGLLARKNTPSVREFNERWWTEIENGSHRDQLSLNYCLYDLRPDTLPFDILRTHFNKYPHNK